MANYMANNINKKIRREKQRKRNMQDFDSDFQTYVVDPKIRIKYSEEDLNEIKAEITEQKLIKMIMKSPSNDWSDQFDPVEEDYDSLSDLEEETDFSEYMWMENEEEFDKDELKRLEEEEIMEQCLEAMFVDELEAEINEWQKVKAEQLEQALSSLAVSDRNVENSILNPLADEFIPMQNYVIDLVIS